MSKCLSKTDESARHGHCTSQPARVRSALENGVCVILLAGRFGEASGGGAAAQLHTVLGVEKSGNVYLLVVVLYLPSPCADGWVVYLVGVPQLLCLTGDKVGNRRFASFDRPAHHDLEASIVGAVHDSYMFACVVRSRKGV